MARPSRERSLGLWMNGERVGRWSVQGRQGEQLHYDPAWLASPRARPLSLSLPLGAAPCRGPAVAAWFDNLLPDSRPIRERIQRRFSASSLQPFDLLTEIGRDCVGAVQLLPPDASPPRIQPIEGEPLSDDDIEALLDAALSPGLGRDDGAEFRISLAGAHEKTALLRHGDRWLRPLGATPTTHILKLAIGRAPGQADLSQSVENEWLCARLLAAFDVPVASCEIAEFGRHRVLVVERFDRRLAASGDTLLRLPQEDFCQATATPPEQKYEADGGPGMRRCLDLLLGSTQAQADRVDFFRTQLLFWLLCAIDGHAKNFSLFLETGGGYRLTPRYDVLSAYPLLGRGTGRLDPHKVSMAMAVEGRSRHYRWNRIQPRHWAETARRAGLGTAWPRLRDELVERTPSAIEAVLASLPASFPADLASTITTGLADAARRLATGSDAD